jgi:hypothetical protein
MPSDMDAISAIVAMGSATIITAADGVTIGAVIRLTTARIESRRGNKVQNFTQAQWHMVQCEKRPKRSHFRQVTRSIAQASAEGMTTYVPAAMPGRRLLFNDLVAALFPIDHSA